MWRWIGLAVVLLVVALLVGWVKLLRSWPADEPECASRAAAINSLGDGELWA